MLYVVYCRVGVNNTSQMCFAPPRPVTRSPNASGYNIAPTTQPILRQEKYTLKRELVPLRWGSSASASSASRPSEPPSTPAQKDSSIARF